ncbi:hypothetical protein BH23VER1_BH23VER1_20900 [soil metagenome]
MNLTNAARFPVLVVIAQVFVAGVVIDLAAEGSPGVPPKHSIGYITASPFLTASTPHPKPAPMPPPGSGPEEGQHSALPGEPIIVFTADLSPARPLHPRFADLAEDGFRVAALPTVPESQPPLSPVVELDELQL